MSDTSPQLDFQPTDEPEITPIPLMTQAYRFKLTGVRKAAILSILLGDEVASEVFRHLDEEEMQAISRELIAMRSISADVATYVLEEFYTLNRAQDYVAQGGLDFAKRLLIKSLGPDNARRILDRITQSIESSNRFQSLRKFDPQQLSKLLQNEHPQTIALVLAHLDASQAAETVSCLPESTQAELIMRMARLQSVSHDVIRRLSIVFEQKLKNMGDFSQQSVGGIRAVAGLCNRLDREVARKMLEEIELSDPNLALSIRNLMVTFDDLLLVEDMGIREILQRVDKKTIALALKNAIPEIQARFFSNMSVRAVEMMKEDMEFMGQVKLKDVSAAQREVVNTLRELDEKGIISLSGSGGEVYVG